jgi:hypothetical protein
MGSCTQILFPTRAAYMNDETFHQKPAFAHSAHCYVNTLKERVLEPISKNSTFFILMNKKTHTRYLVLINHICDKRNIQTNK